MTECPQRTTPACRSSVSVNLQHLEARGEESGCGLWSVAPAAARAGSPAAQWTSRRAGTVRSASLGRRPCEERHVLRVRKPEERKEGTARRQRTVSRVTWVPGSCVPTSGGHSCVQSVCSSARRRGPGENRAVWGRAPRKPHTRCCASPGGKKVRGCRIPPRALLSHTHQWIYRRRWPS